MNSSSKEKTENISTDLHSSGKTYRKIEKRPSRGFLRQITAPYREWREMPHRIRQFPHQSQSYLKKIEEMLIDYRLAIMKSTYMAKNINQRIWDSFQLVKSTNDELLLETNKRALFLHTNKYLSRLLSAWQNLLGKQEELVEPFRRPLH